MKAHDLEPGPSTPTRATGSSTRARFSTWPILFTSPSWTARRDGRHTAGRSRSGARSAGACGCGLPREPVLAASVWRPVLGLPRRQGCLRPDRPSEPREGHRRRRAPDDPEPAPPTHPSWTSSRSSGRRVRSGCAASAAVISPLLRWNGRGPVEMVQAIAMAAAFAGPARAFATLRNVCPTFHALRAEPCVAACKGQRPPSDRRRRG